MPQTLFSNPYIFATRCCRPLIFRSMNSPFEFVAKTQLLSCKVCEKDSLRDGLVRIVVGRIKKHHGMDGLERFMQGQIR